MNAKKTLTLLLTALIAVCIVTAAGCKKKTEPAPPTPQVVEGTVAAVAEQTMCPVMANPINKEIFTVYQGKKVYFCCPECKPIFEKDPNKYLSKLPQFQQ